MGQTPKTIPPSVNALHMACIAGDLAAAQAAVASGIGIESLETVHGNTPLMLAAYNRHPSVVSWLIGSGAAIEARCKGDNTALMKAAWSGATECVALLLQAGADVDAFDTEDMTALMLAAFFGHADVVKLLIDAGADVQRTDNDGYTALQGAENNRQEHIVAILEAAAPRGAHEKLGDTSTNFDPELVERFLIELAARIEHGFSAEAAVNLAAEIKAMALDAKRTWTFRVTCEGTVVPLVIAVFKDDLCSICLYFQTLPRLVNAIEQQIEDWIPILEGEADQRQG
jgi:uncharacterized protein